MDTVPPRRLKDMVEHVATTKDRIVLTKEGRPAAVLVPVEDVALFEAVQEERDSQAVRDAMARLERGELETVTLEDLAAEFGIDLSQIEDDPA